MVNLNIWDIVKLAVSVFISLMAGIAGSFFTAPAIETWYKDLNKPSFNPPAWIFAPVWTVLYLLMGVAAFLVWREGIQHRNVQIGLGLFIFQLILNALWSIIFFGQQNPLAGFVEILVLWVAIAVTIYYFYKVNPTAAYLMIPYILWVTFATILNFSIWQLNT